MNIPKVVHVCWKNKDVVNSQSPLILNGLRNIIDMNPDWNVVVYDDKDIEDYLKEHLTYSNYKLIEDCHIVEKSDMWRLFKMFNEGGMYIDIDRLYNIKMSDILTDGIMCVLPMCLDSDFSQDIMISAAFNPIYSTTLNLIMDRRKQGCKNTYFLGPQTYMHGVTITLLGKEINTNPSKEELQLIKDQLKEVEFIKTFREYPPYDTIVYDHNNNKNNFDKSWEAMKREFYAEQNVKHWTGEW